MGLEAVEVEEQHGAGPLLPLGARKRLRKTVQQERPVGETRQGIMVGQCLDAGLGNLSFGDIQRRAHHAHRPPLSVANDEAAVLYLRIATVTAAKTVLGVERPLQPILAVAKRGLGLLTIAHIGERA